MTETLNGSSTQEPITEIQELTAVFCIMILILLIIGGMAVNLVAMIRLLPVPKVRKNYVTILHIIVVGTVVCTVICPLELVQLINNYFHLGLLWICQVKLFLHVLAQVATFSCTVVIAWERLQKIKNSAKRRSKNCYKKNLLFSLLWVFISPYALYHLVINISMTTPPILIQACQVHFRGEQNSEFINNILVPLLFMSSLLTTGSIYTAGCMKAKKNVKKVKTLKSPIISWSPRLEGRSGSVNRGYDHTEHKTDIKQPSLQQNQETIETKQAKSKTDASNEFPTKDDISTVAMSASSVDMTGVGSVELSAISTNENKSGLDQFSEKEADSDKQLLPNESSSTVTTSPQRIKLNPLRHVRRTASNSWKSVKDAISSKRFVEMASQETGDAVKKLRPELFRTESSFSLISEPKAFQLTGLKQYTFDGKRRSIKGKCKPSSQRWKLLRIDTVEDMSWLPEEELGASNGADMLSEIESECENDTDTPSNLQLDAQINNKEQEKDDKPNLQSMSQNLLSAETKLKVLKHSGSSCSIDANSGAAGEVMDTDQNHCTHKALDTEKSIFRADLTKKTLNIHTVHQRPEAVSNRVKLNQIHSDDRNLYVSDDTLSTDINLKDHQVYSHPTPPIRIIRPSTETVKRSSQMDISVTSFNMQASDFDACSTSSYQNTRRSLRSPVSVNSFWSNISAHSTRSDSIWTTSTATILVKRSVLMVATFGICFLPVSVMQMFASYMSHKALANIYPFLCCIQYVYFFAVPFLYVFTNTSIKEALQRRNT